MRFKVDNEGARRDRVPTAKPTVAGQQARVKGFALDMSVGGPDTIDDEFRESA
ncbi:MULTISPECIES: hypothetical protein [Rhizobium]|uniref:hypothetical protein n=1 Tax=Rhizobium TaxID=379 RepID=UPI0007F0648E|nr:MULTISPECIES: hypothetical protein [Rhizobium]ANK93119.1 hypothetical protein AMK01_CH03713 [Rhizobium sp. N6212]ANK99165.1 hypothetical protein AMK00_CH03716 [Rhizobium sp. N621]ANL05296.1 hypothetical protein AMJ99_CH03795 [Rhizobium esperanzae]ANM36136.1 hypothetical protein AMK04_CH03800 [Rhizobium sp. N871]ANM42194.1 hypothetical protein AMK03_CH03746 [Rhizobium sp. N741]